jgi:hypothetical protein
LLETCDIWVVVVVAACMGVAEKRLKGIMLVSVEEDSVLVGWSRP